MLAAFFNPALLYAAGAAVSVPILIHLLARRRFKRIRWAAMEFLLEAQRRNRRRLRMEEWILLALRCAAVSALGVMVSRPFLEPSGLAAALRGSQRTERVFLLDDSLSMAYRSGDGSPFSRAKEATRRIWETLRRDHADEAVSVFRTSTPDEPVEANQFLSGPQAEALNARLEALQVSQASVDPSRAVRAAADLLGKSPDTMAAAVYVISDFQRKDWVRPDLGSGSDAGAGLLAPLLEWAGPNRGLRLILIDVGDDLRLNSAVTGAVIESGRVVAGAAGVLRVTLANSGPQPRGDLELQTAVDNVPQASKSLQPLGPGQSVSIDVRSEFARAGYTPVRVEIARDRLPEDDVRYAAVEAVSAIRILIVNGEPAADVYSDETAFLSTALRPEGELFSGNEVTVVEESEFESANLGGFHLLVLANVYRISETVVEQLEKYVREGGGLLIFVGDQVDADSYNHLLFRDGAGVLPASLGEVRHPAEPVRLGVSDRLHPALRGLAADGDPLGIGQVPFFEFTACKPAAATTGGTDAPSNGSQNPPGGGESRRPAAPDGTGRSAESNESDSPPESGPSDASSRATRILARFDDAERSPAIVERGLGAGRAVLVSTSADKEWNLWPDHPTFLPVMMELAHYVARRSDPADQRLVGTPLEWPADPAEFETDALLRTPAYPNEPEAVIRATTTSRGAGLAFLWPHTDAAGFYQISMRRRDGTEESRLAAVNVDAAESDLTGTSEDELRRALPGVRFEYVKGLRGLLDTTSESRVEVWRWLLMAATAALLMEHGLAWYWGKRR